MTHRFDSVLVDLDRTIFDTDRFFGSLWDEVARQTGRDMSAERSRAPKHYQRDGELYAYDFFGHIDQESITLDIPALTASLRSHSSFLFADVANAWPVLHGLGPLSIMTYGFDNFQRLKVACCPELDGEVVVTVLQPKGEYLSTGYDPGSRILLIDDKDLADDMPSNVTFLRIRRDVARPSHGEVTTLGDVDNALPTDIDRM